MKNQANSYVIKLLVFTVLTAFCILISPSNISAQWNKLNPGTSNSFNKVDFPSKDTGYVLPFKGKLLRTTDGGNTWDSLSSLSISGSTLFDNHIYFIDNTTGFVSTGNSGSRKLFKTTDMGNTWLEISPDSNLRGILKMQFIDYQRGYAFSNSAYDDRLWTTDDGGTTWTELVLGKSLGSGTQSLPTIFFVNDSTGYIVGGSGTFKYQGKIARTSDYGKNWTFTVLPDYQSLINSIHFLNKDTGYVLSMNGSIFRTVNEGATWDSIASLKFKYTEPEIFFVNSTTGFVIADSFIYKSTDAGFTWRLDFTANEVLFAIDFADIDAGFVVGKNGTILKNGLINGIENPTSSIKNISVYPNPFINEIYIKGTRRNEEVVLLDITGKEILRQKTTDYETKINSAHISPGFYLLSYKEGNRSENIKLIKL